MLASRLAAVAWAFAACVGAQRGGETMAASEDKLVDAVRAAAAMRLPPDQAEARVGRRAIVNTQRGDVDRLRLRGASIFPDDAAQAPPFDFASARDVAYWRRDVPAHNVPIVGIVWKADGSVDAFTGFVLPP
jgi:hypothetical protein